MIGLNDYIEAERTNRFKASQIKKEAETDICTYALISAQNGLLHSHTEPCELWITWVEPNRRRDLDNVSFPTKFIQDCLVKCGVFPDDSTKYIKLLHHTVAYDKDKPRVEITIRSRL